MVIPIDAMIELLNHLHPPPTIDEIKEVLSNNSIKKTNDIDSVLNELNSTDEMAIPTLFRSIILQKRGTIKDEMLKKTENYFQDEIGVETFTTGRQIGKGKTIMTIDVLGRKENKDLCAFVFEDLDIDSFESFKTMLVTILSYAKISPVEIFLVFPREITEETIKHIKENNTLKYVKTTGAEIDAKFKPLAYESELPRTAILTLEREDIFGDMIELGKFSGSSFMDEEELKKFLIDNYNDYGEGLFQCKSFDHFNKKTKQFSIDTTSTLTSDVTEITQTTRFAEGR
ncbi:MAG: hypothetical protein ACFFCD_11850 [Promethearchaeota archaeon]